MMKAPMYKKEETIMPTDIRVVHARDRVRATAEGKLDFATSKKALLELASVDSEILLNTRQADVRMSAGELWNLAAEFSSKRNAVFQKTAVLCPVDQFDKAAFFAFCSRNRGGRVKAFTAFRDAASWLDRPETTNEKREK
jgi:hypothetical protein